MGREQAKKAATILEHEISGIEQILLDEELPQNRKKEIQIRMIRAALTIGNQSSIQVLGGLIVGEAESGEDPEQVAQLFYEITEYAANNLSEDQIEEIREKLPGRKEYDQEFLSALEEVPEELRPHLLALMKYHTNKELVDRVDEPEKETVARPRPRKKAARRTRQTTTTETRVSMNSVFKEDYSPGYSTGLVKGNYISADMGREEMQDGGLRAAVEKVMSGHPRAETTPTHPNFVQRIVNERGEDDVRSKLEEYGANSVVADYLLGKTDTLVKDEPETPEPSEPSPPEEPESIDDTVGEMSILDIPMPIGDIAHYKTEGDERIYSDGYFSVMRTDKSKPETTAIFDEYRETHEWTLRNMLDVIILKAERARKSAKSPEFVLAATERHPEAEEEIINYVKDNASDVAAEYLLTDVELKKKAQMTE